MWWRGRGGSGDACSSQGIKKAGGPIWPSGSCLLRLNRVRQVKKGTDLPRTAAPTGATVRSSEAAAVARKLVIISEICSMQTWLVSAESGA